MPRHRKKSRGPVDLDLVEEESMQHTSLRYDPGFKVLDPVLARIQSSIENNVAVKNTLPISKYKETKIIEL